MYILWSLFNIRRTWHSFQSYNLKWDFSKKFFFFSFAETPLRLNLPPHQPRSHHPGQANGPLQDPEDLLRTSRPPHPGRMPWPSPVHWKPRDPWPQRLKHSPPVPTTEWKQFDVSAGSSSSTSREPCSSPGSGPNSKKRVARVFFMFVTSDFCSCK
jgi:hypothetical protein